MLEPRQELAAAELGGVIYAVGGLAGSATANEAYDPFNDSWSVEADLPIATDTPVRLVSGIACTSGAEGAIESSYDPAFDRWNEVASSAFVHGGTPAAAVLAGRIVVAGGSGGGILGNEVEAYDPLTDECFAARPHGLRPESHRGRGGRRKASRCGRTPRQPDLPPSLRFRRGHLDHLQDFLAPQDVEDKSPEPTKAPLPTGRSGAAGAMIGSCFYVPGSEGNPADPNGIFHEVEAYDPASNAWTRPPPMQTGRHGIYAATVGNVPGRLQS